jgi:hypothetical protein
MSDSLRDFVVVVEAARLASLALEDRSSKPLVLPALSFRSAMMALEGALLRPPRFSYAPRRPGEPGGCWLELGGSAYLVIPVKPRSQPSRGVAVAVNVLRNSAARAETAVDWRTEGARLCLSLQPGQAGLELVLSVGGKTLRARTATAVNTPRVDRRSSTDRKETESGTVSSEPTHLAVVVDARHGAVSVRVFIDGACRAALSTSEQSPDVVSGDAAALLRAFADGFLSPGLSSLHVGRGLHSVSEVKLYAHPITDLHVATLARNGCTVLMLVFLRQLRRARLATVSRVFLGREPRLLDCFGDLSASNLPTEGACSELWTPVQGARRSLAVRSSGAACRGVTSYHTGLGSEPHFGLRVPFSARPFTCELPQIPAVIEHEPFFGSFSFEFKVRLTLADEEKLPTAPVTVLALLDYPLRRPLVEVKSDGRIYMCGFSNGLARAAVDRKGAVWQRVVISAQHAVVPQRRPAAPSCVRWCVWIDGILAASFDGEDYARLSVGGAALGAWALHLPFFSPRLRAVHGSARGTVKEGGGQD